MFQIVEACLLQGVAILVHFGYVLHTSLIHLVTDGH